VTTKEGRKKSKEKKREKYCTLLHLFRTYITFLLPCLLPAEVQNPRAKMAL
jgi:hypothetical protein